MKSCSRELWRVRHGFLILSSAQISALLPKISMPTNPTATAPGQRPHPTKALLWLAASVVFLIFIWHRNYNRLGSFYDYSILTSAVGHLHAGLHPYRDFTTPLQSLTIYLCDAAELAFGRHYLALAYANLIAGLLGGYLVLRLLDTSLPFLLRLLIAIAFCVSTFFQHGILWYDSVAMLLLVLTCLQAAKIVAVPEIPRAEILKLCLLLFLSSINKLNFHLLALAIVCLAFVGRCLLQPARTKSSVSRLALLVVTAIVPGPICEILLNHTTPGEFIENVLRTPSGRGTALLHLLDPNLYLGKLWDFYPDSWISGVFLIGFIIYLGSLYMVITSPDVSAPANRFVKICAWILYPLFFIASLLLTATDLDTEILTSVFLLIGLALVPGLLAKQLSPTQQLVLRAGIAVFATFFLIAGSASAFMHSRIRYWDSSWTSSMLDAIRTKRTLSAIKNAVPFHDAKTISPALEPYFTGVRFTETAQKKLARVASFMKRFEGTTNAPDIYWGPDLEILGRVYNTPYRGRLPLWYHNKVSVREQDAPWIIRELEQARYEWIVATPLVNDMPQEVREYIQKSYDCVEDDEILVYHRRR